jgi:hypothetical protein
MGFNPLGVWVIGYGGFMGVASICPPTNFMDLKSHGFSEVMGFREYGLLEVRLYTLLSDGMGAAASKAKSGGRHMPGPRTYKTSRL